MIDWTQNDLPAILEQHRLWLRSEGGSKANLRDADLGDVNLRYADLGDVNLRYANLRGANLYGANLYGADLRDADLGGADLRDVNLQGADLRDADLRDANLDKGQTCSVNPVFFSGGTWPVMITDRHIKIGCEAHTTEEWGGFDDRAILAMDGRFAMEFWRLWKPTILAMAAAHQSRVGQETPHD
jgi:uncharacterized protein YjbI with pentapeptide repeats